MKKIYPVCLFLLVLLTGQSLSLHAQCTIDSTQTIPGVYPDTVADAVVFNAYSQDVTFVMITDTLGFTITNFQIAAITGLPAGISWVCNNSFNGCNYDPAINLYGCVNLSGIPLVSGSYIANVNVIATLSGLGDQSISYLLPMNVLPDTVGNAGFSMTNSSGCAPLTVSFINNVPGQTAYLWDFANGVNDTSENPVPQVYPIPGDYVVSQTITPDAPPQYFLTDVTVTSVPDNYNELGFLDPDPDLYFVISDTAGNTFYDSRPATNNTQPPYTWTLPNLSLGDQTYTLQVFDQDSLIVSLGDDDLGTITFAGWGSSGSATATVPGASGQLDLSYTIFMMPVLPVTYTDTVHVFPAPPVPVVNANGPLTVCEGDTVTLTSSAVSGNQWYDANGMLPGATLDVLAVTAAGTYFTVVTSSNGCTSSSAGTTVNVNPLPPKPTLFAIGDTIFCALPGYSLQWYLNGNILNGATGSYYIPLVDGTYSVVATDVNGCSHSSDPLLFVGVGITEVQGDVRSFEAVPNPSTGLFTIHLEVQGYQDLGLFVRDVTGRVAWEKMLTGFSGSGRIYTDLSAYPAGTYLLELKGNKVYLPRRIMVVH